VEGDAFEHRLAAVGEADVLERHALPERTHPHGIRRVLHLDRRVHHLVEALGRGLRVHQLDPVLGDPLDRLVGGGEDGGEGGDVADREPEAAAQHQQRPQPEHRHRHRVVQHLDQAASEGPIPAPASSA
jgi:hypothetical protein